ncbi:hypothetical protein CK227_10265 [Mesorhizobium sp. WSM4308]|uniref:hypothetical protein n=1 Tax=Mesorhizobium sp. WSM4308 TaxID=2029409 RepID=UPI000BAFDB96|nr:hypothetical protein [Mesorhizobium sp. WSM4308]PBB75167.1 hypothetical protein CK227_10265 [Mesorhizobium sp. WSM4308]
MTTAPINLRYEGEGNFRVMSNYWAARADKDFVIGEVYKMVEHHDRSQISHNHYFAALGNAWSNLPDRLFEEFPTAEVLRKKLLIRAGYADERSIVCASKAEAQRVAAFIKPMDDYAVVTVREAVVRVYTAQSQSVKAMGAKPFQASKQAVLDALDDLLGVERGVTERSEAA